MAESDKPDVLAKAALTQIGQVVKDLQSRPDYGKTQADSVKGLDAFTLLLRKLVAASPPPPELTKEVQAQATGPVLPMLADLISKNVTITKAGPLSLAQTIPPKMAKAHNVNLHALQQSVQEIAALPTGGEGEGEEGEIDPEKAEAELLIEILRSKTTSDPEADEEIERLSGEDVPFE